MCLFVEKLLSFKKSMRPRAKRSLKEPSRDALIKASGDSFEIGDGRILIYSSIGVQNSIF